MNSDKDIFKRYILDKNYAIENINFLSVLAAKNPQIVADIIYYCPYYNEEDFINIFRLLNGYVWKKPIRTVYDAICNYMFESGILPYALPPRNKAIASIHHREDTPDELWDYKKVISKQGYNLKSYSILLKMIHNTYKGNKEQILLDMASDKQLYPVILAACLSCRDLPNRVNIYQSTAQHKSESSIDMALKLLGYDNYKNSEIKMHKDVLRLLVTEICNSDDCWQLPFKRAVLYKLVKIFNMHSELAKRIAHHISEQRDFEKIQEARLSRVIATCIKAGAPINWITDYIRYLKDKPILLNKIISKDFGYIIKLEEEDVVEIFAAFVLYASCRDMSLIPAATFIKNNQKLKEKLINILTPNSRGPFLWAFDKEEWVSTLNQRWGWLMCDLISGNMYDFAYDWSYEQVKEVAYCVDIMLTRIFFQDELGLANFARYLNKFPIELKTRIFYYRKIMELPKDALERVFDELSDRERENFRFVINKLTNSFMRLMV
jgi:hypothetical protein